MGNASTVFERMMMNPPSEALQLQRDAITAFGWSIDDDRKAVESVKEILNDMLDDSDLIWKKLADSLTEARGVTIVGADADADSLPRQEHEQFIVADGAFAAFTQLEPSIIKRVIAIVSDADGGEGMRQAMEHSHIVWILHPHGDNLEEVTDLAQHLRELERNVVLTHQLEEEMIGAINIGGLTDGDRAACLARCVLDASAIKLSGFSIDGIGRWSGQSNPEQKLLKLDWMARILDSLGLMISEPIS